MVNLFMHKIKNRSDVSAVMGVLRKRLEIEPAERSPVRMDNENGKTWVGLLLWNVGTLIQDFPNAFLLGAFAVAACTLAIFFVSP